MTTAGDLRAAQAPLRDRYRTDPAAAITPTEATGAFVDDGITVTVAGFAGPVRAGLHAAVGGTGDDACSADMLLEALIGCAGVTFRSVATAMRIPYDDVHVTAASTWDARGTLGIARDIDVGVAPIHVSIELVTDADDATLTKAAELTERYCVVGQSLKHPPVIEIRRA
jgi:uncharacterized OsmC-like protein